MTRKKVADNSAVSTSENPAGAAAPKKARTPRASSTAVTHKHKKAAAAGAAEPVPEVASSTSGARAFVPPTEEEIAIRAYLIAESRGFQGGSPSDDWFQAERELLAERQANLA